MTSLISSKPIVFGLTAAAFDQYLLREESLNRSLMFGGACAISEYVAQAFLNPIIVPMIAPIPSLSPEMYQTKPLTERIVEVSSSSLMVWVLIRYFGISIYSNEFMKRVGTIAAANVASEYIIDYMGNKPLDAI